MEIRRHTKKLWANKLPISAKNVTLLSLPNDLNMCQHVDKTINETEFMDRRVPRSDKFFRGKKL